MCLGGARWAVGGSLLVLGTALAAQTEQPTVPPQPAAIPQAVPKPSDDAPPPSGGGTVLFQSHGEPPSTAPEEIDPHRKLLPTLNAEPETDAARTPDISDRERSSLLFTSYDLDVRVVSATAKLTVRARVTVRNGGDVPLRHIALQISSALRWESLDVVTADGTRKLALAQHLLDTDADHTGKASEAVLELPTPLAPGASVTLNAFYAGTVTQSAERLTRIGATEKQGTAADWDAAGPGALMLRGFGNVLWYPVSAPQLFLGDGTRLFRAIDQTRLDDQAATVRLRLSVEFQGDPPTAAYFCGRRAALAAVSDAPDAPIAGGTGVATAEFAPEPLGFRIPSLFVLAQPELLTAPLAGELAGGEPMLAVENENPTESAAPALASATQRLVPLLQQWLGARPLSALSVIDHPGQPFQDGPLLVAPASSLTGADAEPALIFSLAHAWVQTGRPWVDEGLAQFFALLEIEQAHGRDAMVSKLGELLQPLRPDASALAADTPDAMPPAEPLIATGSETIYRRKAAAVWVMLRELVGEQALQITLQAWRLREPAKTTAEQDALVLEGMLEKNSGKDLHLFFEDWVLHDRGLPELTVAEVTPRPLPTTENGHQGGWLTAITVSNAGAAMASVPIIVRSGSFSTTARLLIPGAGSTGPGTATARVQTESAPTEVQVNDGTTPEVRTSVHRREVRSR